MKIQVAVGLDVGVGLGGLWTAVGLGGLWTSVGLGGLWTAVGFGGGGHSHDLQTSACFMENSIRK